ncbi:NHL repeat-containing protein [Streptomyces lavendulae]|uniref:Vgb family protein n=1 Tax=Streptomyces lavendulae TaxID=1914 RepID=UPI00332935A0
MTVHQHLPAGTILLADSQALGCAGMVFRVDPVTGEVGQFALGGELQGATGIAIESDGNIVVSKDRSFPGTGILLRLDGRTGAQSEVTSGGKFTAPIDVAVEADGNILVADVATGGFGAVIRVNRTTGKQTVLSQGDGSGDPAVRAAGLCVAPDGSILVVEQNMIGGEDLSSRLVRVDRVSGARTTVTSGGELRSPCGVVVDSAGHILIADANAFPGFGGGVIKVDPATGAQTTVSSGGGFVAPASIAIEADGSLLVTDSDPGGTDRFLFRVDPVTGAQKVVASGGQFKSLVGVAVVR